MNTRSRSAVFLLSLAIIAFSIPFGIADDLAGRNALAKNVILLIGDGMGFPQLTLARIDKAGENLSEYASVELFMDRMEQSGYVSTFSANSFVTDSAPASTAMATGHKTNNGVISQDETAIPKEMDGKNLTTILEMAENAGLSTGLITTTRITHATPAAFYAHVDNRDNESEIADQLSKSNVEVILGGGLQYFVGKNETDPTGKEGKRNDDRNLLADFESQGYALVYNGSAFQKIDANKTEKLLGLFESSHMQYELERSSSQEMDPSLAEMTKKATAILSKNARGFFLMVEGGRIDHAGHERNLSKIAVDTLAFDEAVREALDFASKNNDTLVVVTADHECGGLVLQPMDLEVYEEGSIDPIFASGTARTSGPRYDFITEMDEATHTAVDVPVMASGPGAEKVSHGKLDNTQIFEIMKEALGF
ncbi:MAG: alkaline phosphatase [Methanotrichaceae archaeon]|nr:alkaline phosphatase [Methanotrichaceae archaeon]